VLARKLGFGVVMPAMATGEDLRITAVEQ